MNNLSEAARRFIGDIHSLAKCFESGAKFSGFTMPITIIDTLHLLVLLIHFDMVVPTLLLLIIK